MNSFRTEFFEKSTIKALSFKALMLKIAILAICATSAVFIPNTTYGQNHDASFEIRHRIAPYSPPANATENFSLVDRFQRQLFQSQNASANKFFLLLQFYNVPDSNTLSRLNKNGIELLEYIPENAYYASIPENCTVETLRLSGVRSIDSIRVDNKIDERLRQSPIPVWTTDMLGKVYLHVTFFKDVNISLAKMMLTSIGANLESEMEGFSCYTVSINETEIYRLAALPFIMDVSTLSVPKKAFNREGKNNHRSNYLQRAISLGGRGLDGAGVKLGIWDNGNIGSHIDFQNRLTQVESSSYGDHATHCLGTAAGAGIRSATAMGMSPAMSLYAWNYDGDIPTEMRSGVTTQGVMITTNSYGYTDQSACGSRGIYDSEARSLDILVRDFPNLVHVFAAGNEATDCTNGWGTVGDGMNSAKNIITVGAVNSTDAIANFSSRGPVLDGRIKPEICGVGVNVYSTQTNDTYEGGWNGTSMATPGVAGTIGQLYERYRQMNSNANPAASLMKAIVCNTADDLGNAGPDYIYGFGRINGARALAALDSGWNAQNSISQGQTQSITINVPDNTSQLRVMLCWTDKEATAGSAYTLINNLNLQATPLGGAAVNPWILSSTNPGNVATRGIDTTNNIEQVTVDNPATGQWTISVSAPRVTFGPQSYSIVYEFVKTGLNITYPIGGESLSTRAQETIRWDAYNLSSPITIEITTNNGTSWVTLVSNLAANTRSYSWTPNPSQATLLGKIRITSGTYTSISPNTFNVYTEPVDLVLTTSLNRVTCQWTAVSGATSYEVFRLNNYIWTYIGNTATTQYLDNTVTAGTRYWYAVLARNSTAVSPLSYAQTIVPQNPVNLSTYTFAYQDAAYSDYNDGSLGPTGDDVSIIMSLPINFVYAGSLTSQITLCTNGWIQMGGTETGHEWINRLDTASKFVCAFWEDLHIDAAANLRYKATGTYPFRVFNIEWQNAKYYTRVPRFNIQMRLFEGTNAIEFAYGTITNPTSEISASIGITGYGSGTNNFISITPLATPTASQTVANNVINDVQSAFTVNKIYKFAPIGNVDPPVLILPANTSTSIALAPMFDWNDIANATSYVLQISTISDFSQSVLEFQGITQSTYTPPYDTLSRGTVYYWRVMAKSALMSSLWSATWQFTTITLQTPTLIYPPSNAFGVPTAPIFLWSSVAGAVSYHLQVSTVSLFATTIINQTDITNTQFQSPALDNGLRYYWRVRSYNGTIYSQWSLMWTFKVKVLTPTLVYPSLNSYDVELNPVFQWNSSVGATNYIFQASTDPDFATLIAENTSLTDASFQSPTLTWNTMYYWRVKAYTSTDTSEWSTTWNFRTVRNLIITTQNVPPNFCLGSTVAIQYTVNDTFNLNNVFTVQLSNSSGSFASPTSIGTLTANNSGVITCIIPTTLAEATTYKLRIISSSPQFTSTPEVSNISLASQATIFNVSGGGTYCEGETGLSINLSGSQIGYVYQLYLDNNFTGSILQGTGSALSFTNQTLAGLYTVHATSISGQCPRSMNGSGYISINPAPIAQTMTGGGSYCIGGTGMPVGLTNSQRNVQYKLYRNNVFTGTTLNGTDGPLSYGNQTTAGDYTIQAVNVNTNCTSWMTGSLTVTVVPLPQVFTVSGGGQFCSGSTGTTINLSGSELNTNYHLRKNGVLTGASITGTGGPISFVGVNDPGTYTVSAMALSLQCSNIMTGSAVADTTVMPASFNVTGGGGYCEGSQGIQIGLVGSETTISYQLQKNSINIGSPVVGTGSAINFSYQTEPGNYTVIGTNIQYGCQRVMSGISIVFINPVPLVFTITGGGVLCSGASGVTVGLSGSQTGVNYQLKRNGSSAGLAIAGTGSALTFPLQSVAGTYTVTAISQSSLCTTLMSGSTEITIQPLPMVFNITGGGTFCEGAAGLPVGLSGSQVGINYQLKRNNISIGDPIAGTGNAIAFGLQNQAGTYKVTATNATTGCTKDMSGFSALSTNPQPTSFTVTGGGSFCEGSAGVAVGLSGSQTGVNYQLKLNGANLGNVVNGTGNALNFGLQTQIGTYTVSATNATTACTNNMTGSVAVQNYPQPAAFTVTGGGSFCEGSAGVAVGLSGSQTGVNYQLKLNGANLGNVVNGTGNALNFGLQTQIGTYTVSATNATTACTNNMTGSVAVQNYPQPAAFTVTGGGSFCEGSAGVAVGLSGSQTGVNYQLKLNGANLGNVVNGTGNALNFGLQTQIGTYTVSATNATTACTNNMTGSVAVQNYPQPAAFTVTGGGSFCEGSAGVAVGLSGSQTGVNYQLKLNGANLGNVVNGTGNALNFGLQTQIGTYTVSATNATTACTNNMTGSVAVQNYPQPAAFTVTGGGSFCEGSAGVAVGLSGSQTGVNYQLKLNGANLGNVVNGTGNALNFGLQTQIGTYTVSATNATTACTNNMTGSVAVQNYPQPAAFTVTGGGSFCEGSAGVAVGLSGSQTGVNYQLKLNGANLGNVVNGTGNALNFGLQTQIGTYTVSATNATTACTNNMTGSVAVQNYPQPAAFTVTGGGSFCEGSAGVAVGLSGSQTGVNYQLKLNGTNLGTTLAGTGNSLSFGLQTQVGTYTVSATNATTTCTNNMTGSVAVQNYPQPAAFTVTGGGSFCEGSAGVAVGLSGSQTGVNYQLKLNGANLGNVVNGTGNALNFGLQTQIGTYTVSATNATTACTNNMTGSVAVQNYPQPAAFTVTGGGSFCEGSAGVAVGLSGSQTGVNYQLKLNGTNLGTTLAGTGNSLSFGLQTQVGTYTVSATNATTTCSNNMTGSVAVQNYPQPTSFTVTGGGSFCEGSAGVAVGLSGSQTGVNYQLKLNGANLGNVVNGTGNALSFGLQTQVGTYTVDATEQINSCVAVMDGSAIVNPQGSPTVYNVIGGGTYCEVDAGIAVMLSSSEAGAMYQLLLDSQNIGDPLPGTGAELNFGLQSAAGTYKVVAYYPNSTCFSSMADSAIVVRRLLPPLGIVFGGGAYCVGTSGSYIGITDTKYGIMYQLIKNNILIGNPIMGNDYSLLFDPQTEAGVYGVMAYYPDNTCSRQMQGTATVTVNPVPQAFTIFGGGDFCEGGAGVEILLNGSQSGNVYRLRRNGTYIGTTVTGTGDTISFGFYSIAGRYSVIVIDPTSQCTNNMLGEVIVSVDPMATPICFGPGHNSTGIGTNPTEFSWSPLLCASSYHLVVSRNQTLSSPVIDIFIPASQGSQYSVNTLLNNTIYYWQIIALNGTIAKTSQISKFTTGIGNYNQKVIIKHGWNVISTYLQPVDSAMSAIWLNKTANLLIIKDGAGTFWMPPTSGTLNYWNYLNGYQVYVNVLDTLTVAGSFIPSTTPIPMNQSGWYMISYLPQGSMQAQTALSSIQGKFAIVKNGSGEMYMPIFGINSLENSAGTMVPGRGYLIYMVSPANLVYAPEARIGDRNVFESLAKPQYLKVESTNTGNSANIVVVGKNIPDGTEIGIYNSKQELISSAVYSNGRAALTVWGKSKYNDESVAAGESEVLFAAARNNVSGEVSVLKIKDIYEISSDNHSANLLYKQNGIFIISAESDYLSSQEQNQLSIEVTPNPVAEQSMISYNTSESGYCRISLYNLQGELSEEIFSGNSDKGWHTTQLSTKNISSGVYTLVIESVSRKAVKQIVIVK